ncbi:hypothetical protein ASPSYDRAFT_886156 [Aspergillus sydowii CBS 593.65]|uniref:Uncharacterized protein n=1 Tax=Aspergillus sydowii CBS 593.65 TaxID=1036612 RepID=A0A1L9TJN8_9EURO|nr:uncharacterized protein ASPSYDRAFT_886156 [Aspergillus sydowii CBS 593.65]OJJ59636.1 hypothetical protein ASPSYDRAFT_886156 [Aspergillus sydowii CBS 593.65]
MQNATSRSPGMAAASHPLSAGITSLVSAICPVFSSSLVPLRDKLARARVQCAPPWARLSLRLSLRLVLSLGVLVSTSALLASTSSTASWESSTALRLLLLGRLGLCLLLLTKWILLVSTATATTSSTSCNWKAGLQRPHDSARRCRSSCASWWLVWQRRTLRLLFVLNLRKRVGCSPRSGRGSDRGSGASLVRLLLLWLLLLWLLLRCLLCRLLIRLRLSPCRGSLWCRRWSGGRGWCWCTLLLIHWRCRLCRCRLCCRLWCRRRNLGCRR